MHISGQKHIWPAHSICIDRLEDIRVEIVIRQKTWPKMYIYVQRRNAVNEISDCEIKFLRIGYYKTLKN